MEANGEMLVGVRLRNESTKGGDRETAAESPSKPLSVSISLQLPHSSRKLWLSSSLSSGPQDNCDSDEELEENEDDERDL